MIFTLKKTALDYSVKRSPRINYLFKMVSRYHPIGESTVESLKRGLGRGLSL